LSGVLHILQYNRHYYLAGIAALLGLGFLLRFDVIPFLPPSGRIVLLAAMGLVIFWSVGSLAASYYVYDYAGVTRWTWIPAALMASPHRWLNVHAGLDESSDALMRMFPNANGIALDLYDPAMMTETSIARARRAGSLRRPELTGRLDAFPAADTSYDTLFLLLAAHEVRQPERREDLFREVARVLTEPGQVLLAEHLRDWRNFLAFGPGFLHFHSRHEWIRVAEKAGFVLEREGSTTSLVRWFLLKKGRV